MATFAKLNDNNIVIEVHGVANAAIDSKEEEASGIAFLTEWSGGYTNWKQTSYNAAINGFRKNYAGVGYYFDEARNAFIPPKRYNSWILNEETCQWQAPVAYPTDGLMYSWDESNVNWQAIEYGVE
jgi:hypothetical protein